MPWESLRVLPGEYAGEAGYTGWRGEAGYSPLAPGVTSPVS